MKNRFILFIPAISWFLISFYLLTIPGTSLPKISFFDKYQLDKAVHISMFFILGYLLSFPLKESSKKYFWIGVIAVSGLAYGISMEFVQKYFIPFRTCDIDDMLADGAGCLIAWYWWRIKFKATEAI